MSCPLHRSSSRFAIVARVDSYARKLVRSWTCINLANMSRAPALSHPHPCTHSDSDSDTRTPMRLLTTHPGIPSPWGRVAVFGMGCGLRPLLRSELGQVCAVAARIACKEEPITTIGDGLSLVNPDEVVQKAVHACVSTYTVSACVVDIDGVVTNPSAPHERQRVSGIDEE